MALFGSSKKATKTSLKKIRPTVMRTQNVAKELIAIAKSYDVNTNTVDFNILEVQTYIRVNADAKEAEWNEIAIEEVHSLEDKGLFLDKNFEIKQMYEIELYSKSHDDLYAGLHLAIAANATKCKIYLTIKEGSKVTYNPRFENDLNLLIDKSKVRANILVDVFDDMQSDVVSKIAAHVRVEENVIYENNETYLIAKAYEPTPTTDDELILHFEIKDVVDEHHKINYSDRGFIQSVQKDELLIEYIKPKDGKSGRNCRGEYIEPKEPEESQIPNFTTDDTIKVIDGKNSIEYRAVENGFISQEGGVYSIKSEVDIGEISFKTTGSISSGLESEVTINVKETDSVKDAIGTGMVVEVSEIEIEGNVGSNAKVTAMKAFVGGQTHKTAIVTADSLDIHIHKGEAYGKNIHITRLEHGIVEGDTVEITQAMGGTVKAKEIEIELCGSYVTATASRLIEINKLQGSENSFIIDPLLKKDILDGFGENQEEIKELEVSLKSMKKDIDKYTILIKENVVAFKELKKRLVHYKKNGVNMPNALMKQYKNFQKTQKFLSALTKEYQIKTDQLTLLTTRTASFQDNIFDARIINRDKWVGHNQIVFRLVDPPMEITYKPQEGSKEKMFAIVENEDGEFKIEAVEE